MTGLDYPQVLIAVHAELREVLLQLDEDLARELQEQRIASVHLETLRPLYLRLVCKQLYILVFEYLEPALLADLLDLLHGHLLLGEFKDAPLCV